MRIDYVTSAYTFNRDFSKLLMVWHKELKVWLPPGGHVSHFETFTDAVIRELKEETGIVGTILNVNQQRVINHTFSPEEKFYEIFRPYAIIIETIPKSFQEEEHLHLDAIYVLSAEDEYLAKVSDSGVSTSIWIPIDELNDTKTFPNVLVVINSIINSLKSNHDSKK